MTLCALERSLGNARLRCRSDHDACRNRTALRLESRQDESFGLQQRRWVILLRWKIDFVTPLDFPRVGARRHYAVNDRPSRRTDVELDNAESTLRTFKRERV